MVCVHIILMSFSCFSFMFHASAWPLSQAEVAETISLERFLDSWHVNGCTGSTEIRMKRHLHPEFS